MLQVAHEAPINAYLCFERLVQPLDATSPSQSHQVRDHAQEFSLPLAVALGACSFEAYNLPYEMHGLKVQPLPILHGTHDVCKAVMKGTVVRVHACAMHGRQRCREETGS